MTLQKFFTLALVVLCAVVMAIASPADAAPRKKKTYAPPPDRYAHIVIEASTGYVISARNPDKQLYPASLTKMMTLYMAFDAMAQGKLGRNQYIRVSRHAARQEPSSLGLREGDTIRVDNVILGIATKSANDASVVLAEAISGSEERFARAMTAKARALGMHNTNFVNASGLHNKAQYSTARDMATLSQALLRDHPRYYRYFSTGSFTYGGHTYFNHNKLMNTYRGMDGIKTGYIHASGFNLAASATRDGTRLIGVVFGGQTSKSRNDAMAKLLDDGFNRISNVRVAENRNPSPKADNLPVRRPAHIQQQQTVIDNTPDLIDQGDADMQEEATAVPARHVAMGAGGSWAIQVGAFASRDAGLRAVESAQQQLKTAATPAVTPFMTNRGLIYQARLIGMTKDAAREACRILKDSCMVLATN